MIKNIKFIKSAEYEKDFPIEQEYEIAFIGRSNVGKSSLINRVTNNRKIARVSKTPGCTKLINFFLANSRFYLVDLPGYGFAKVALSEQSKWERVVEDYLRSPRLKKVFLLIDSRRGLGEREQLMLDWMKHYNIDHSVIYTKIDKLKKNDLRAMKMKVEGVYISSHSGEGVEELNKIIDRVINRC